MGAAAVPVGFSATAFYLFVVAVWVAASDAGLASVGAAYTVGRFVGADVAAVAGRVGEVSLA